MLLKLLSQLGRARVGNRQCFAVILIFINVFLLKMKKPIAYLWELTSSGRLCISRPILSLWGFESIFCWLTSTFSHFWNPGFQASKNRATARFFERISFLYPQDVNARPKRYFCQFCRCIWTLTTYELSYHISYYIKNYNEVLHLVLLKIRKTYLHLCGVTQRFCYLPWMEPAIGIRCLTL